MRVSEELAKGNLSAEFLHTPCAIVNSLVSPASRTLRSDWTYRASAAFVDRIAIKDEGGTGRAGRMQVLIRKSICASSESNDS